MTTHDNMEQTSTELIKSTPQSPREQVSMPVGLSVFIVVIGCIIWGAFVASDWLKDEQKLPVQDIVFTGQTEFVDLDAMERQLRREHAESFFAIDVNDVHSTVEQHPWVYNASIRKRWPSSLYIHIVEQIPVAIWNQSLLLNQYGEPFSGEPQPRNLPLLFGPEGSEKTALVGYNHMRSLLRASDQRIGALMLSERFAWRIRLDNDIVLNLGRQEYVDRLQRYIDVFPLLREQSDNIEYIDLRYDTGMAVGWKDASGNNAKRD